MSEMRDQALFPLQRAMRMLTSGWESTYCKEGEGELQMAAMRILANVSWVLEIADKSSLQQGQPTVSTVESDNASCKK